MKAKIILSLPDECFVWDHFPTCVPEDQNEHLRAELLNTWNDVWTLAHLKKDEKGPIRYGYLSLLRTQICEGTFALRIDLYNEKWYMDADECSLYWDASAVFGEFYEEYLAKRKKLSHYVLQKEYDNFFLQQYQGCLTLLHSFVRRNKNELLACEAFEKASLDEPPHLYIGEYNGSVRSLF